MVNSGIRMFWAGVSNLFPKSAILDQRPPCKTFCGRRWAKLAVLLSLSELLCGTVDALPTDPPLKSAISDPLEYCTTAGTRDNVRELPRNLRKAAAASLGLPPAAADSGGYSGAAWAEQCMYVRWARTFLASQRPMAPTAMQAPLPFAEKSGMRNSCRPTPQDIARFTNGAACQAPLCAARWSRGWIVAGFKSISGIGSRRRAQINVLPRSRPNIREAITVNYNAPRLSVINLIMLSRR
jgi:hypothetical protein